MLLNEISTSISDVTWNYGSDITMATFNTASGGEVVIVFEYDVDDPDDIGWHIDFTVDEYITPQAARSSENYQIFATVFSCIYEFINKINPMVLSFICSSPGLYKLYSRFVRTPQITSKYNVRETQQFGSDPWYILTKKKF